MKGISNMQIGMIGLGRMGSNIVRRLTRAGHRCVVYDRDPNAVRSLQGAEVSGAADLKALVRQLEIPRAVWVMVPAGAPTEYAIGEVSTFLEAGDIVIDGGNSFYKDDIRRAKELGARGIRYVDCGTSGGIWGLERGYCLMIGGDGETVAHLDPIFAALAPGPGDIPRSAGRESRDPRVERGYMHCGGSGAGHFVKMIHNAIEYGLMQAYAEGFNILKGAAERPDKDERYALDLADIAELWRRGSVIGSWLLDLAAKALAEDAALERYAGVVEDSGEGRWAIDTAVEEAVPANVLAAALFARFRSREKTSFADKLLSALRHEFGGHRETGEGTR
jgi:6-phosphogluconate dehydrogenase